jgi:hypothetical protein
MKTYFERVCGSYVGVHTAEDIFVTSKMTNSVFSRQNVRAHGPCNKCFAGAQNRRDADPVKSEKKRLKEMYFWLQSVAALQHYRGIK